MAAPLATAAPVITAAPMITAAPVTTAAPVAKAAPGIRETIIAELKAMKAEMKAEEQATKVTKEDAAANETAEEQAQKVTKEAAAAKEKAEEQARKVIKEAAAAKAKAEEVAKKDSEKYRRIVEVDISGFARDEMNQRYVLNKDLIIQDQATFCDSKGACVIYWQKKEKRWAICSTQCLEQVKAGKGLGWAYRSDNLHPANACGWIEFRDNTWMSADHVKTSAFGLPDDTVVNPKKRCRLVQSMMTP